MALTTETRTTNAGKDYEFYVTEDDGGTKYGIYKNGLEDVDTKALEDVDSNGSGSNLKEKLKDYRLNTNGKDGFYTYESEIVNIDTFMDNIEKAFYGETTNATILEHETRIGDVETRVSDLEGSGGA